MTIFANKSAASIFALMAVFSSLPAFAEDAAADPLYDYITSVSQAESVDDVLYGDIDQDGANEAVILLSPVDGQPDREWRYIDMLDGAPAVTFSWYGQEIRIDETEGDGRLIWSDGITFAAGKVGLYPFFDLIRQNISFVRPATDREIEAFHALGFTNAEPRFAQAVKADVTSDPGSEVIISLSDEMYADEFYVTPYVILTGAGDLIHHGTSQFHPAIFVNPKGGVHVIEQKGGSYEVFPLDSPERAEP